MIEKNSQREHRKKAIVTCTVKGCKGYSHGVYPLQFESAQGTIDCGSFVASIVNRSNCHTKIVILLALFAFVSQSFSEETAPDIPKTALTFVENYCLECHDDITTKGDRDFLPFLDDPTDPSQLITLEEILDQLNLGEMPPKKKGVDQPTDNERRATIDSITKYLLFNTAADHTPDTKLRRLTRHEYKYTIRDLLGIDTTIIDETTLFPEDQNQHGFVNIGEAQALSQHQLKLYLDAGRAYIDRALVFTEEQPDKKRWDIAPSEFSSGSPKAPQVAYRALSEDGSYVDIAHGEPADRRLNIPSSFKRKTIPASGTYRIRVKAQGVGRLDHGYDPEILKVDTSQPIKLGVWFGENRGAMEKTTTRGRHLAAVYPLKDNQPESFELTTWMPKGAVPAFNWINGSGAAKGPVGRIIQHYHPDADPIRPTEADELRQQGKAMTDEEVAKFNANQKPIGSVYRGPRLRIHEIVIEGPLEESWPPRSHSNLVGLTTRANEVNIPEALTKFAEKAWRRPVSQLEITHYISFVDQLISNSNTHADAIKSGLAAILTSPEFLYFNEGNADNSDQLAPHQIANRLSYFLWSSLPDSEFMKASGTATIGKQFETMLADPRSEAFYKHFTEAWLRLDKLGSMPPGPKQFPNYLQRRLEDAMRTETQMLVKYVVEENRPITDLINADYSFLNDSLAEHYGIEGVTGEEFRKVSLPVEARRRGLTGHASILTASANGVETSPVLRGMWVLESILGTPPPPPPPDVPPIEPDTRGTVTIRDQLAKHRDVAACADCHARIDPWGFAMEFYDPIGGLRTNYPKNGTRGSGPQIDGSSTLLSGDQIQNEAELRKVLVDRKDLVTRNLIRKLLIYATGRKLGFQDNAEVEEIAEAVAEGGYKMRDLLERVVTSEIFRQP